MKKVLFLALILLAAVSCKKDTENPATDPTGSDTPQQQTDPRDAIIGTYDLTIDCVIYPSCDNSTIASLLPDSIPFDNEDKPVELKIEKDESRSAYVKLTGFYDCCALVSGNSMMLESSTRTDSLKASDFIETSLLDGITIPITYTLINEAATINGNTITWNTSASGNASVSLSILGTINFTGTGTLKNKAVKK